MDALTAAKLWLTVQPIKRFKAWRANRRARKASRNEAPYHPPDELSGEFFPHDEDSGMAIDLGTRTTTNMTISGFVVYGVMKLVSTYFPGVPTEGLEELVAAVVAYVVGYFTKTPVNPKIL